MTVTRLQQRVGRRREREFAVDGERVGVLVNEAGGGVADLPSKMLNDESLLCRVNEASVLPGARLLQPLALAEVRLWCDGCVGCVCGGTGVSGASVVRRVCRVRRRWNGCVGYVGCRLCLVNRVSCVLRLSRA